MMKKCEQCDTILRPGNHDTPSKFAKRRYCSIQCCGEAKATPLPQRTCPSCDRRIERRDGEARNHFAKRVHCSKECSNGSASSRAPRHDVFGVALTLADIALIAGVSKACIAWRIKQGNDALTGRNVCVFEGPKGDNIPGPQGQVGPPTGKNCTQIDRENNPRGGSD